LNQRFCCSLSTSSISIAPMKDQIQEMRETITKLNVELLAKTDKERTLEEKMLRLIENHDRQSQEMWMKPSTMLTMLKLIIDSWLLF